MTDYIESVLAEANANPDAQPVVDATEADTQEAESTEAKAEETTQAEESQEPEAKQDDEAWPKKAVNTVSKLKNQRYKLSTENAQLKARISELEASLNKAAPKEEDFEDKPYAEFAKATAEHAADKRFAERELENLKEYTSNVDAQIISEQKAAIDDSAAKAEKTYPDFKETIESALVANERGEPKLPLSPQLNQFLHELDDGASALYAIIKDGALHQLNALSGTQLAFAVKEYELKAQNLPKIKRVSDAPPPLEGAKGRGRTSKPIEEYTPEEAYKLLKR